MKRIQVMCALALLVVLGLGLSLTTKAQEKQPSAEPKREIPLRVAVVFEEYDGQKKIASLPYSFLVVTNGNNSSIRDGLRVPVSTGGSTNGANTQFQYMDVGANIDCNAWMTDDGSYKLKLNVQRTFLFTPDELKPAMDMNKVALGIGGNPVVQTFNSSFFLVMKNGQTQEATAVTNPLNGRVLKVLITINVEK
ncbi:MAG: hypothetical protein WAM91_09755 [Candidatus Acidiferrales bacterium]